MCLSHLFVLLFSILVQLPSKDKVQFARVNAPHFSYNMSLHFNCSYLIYIYGFLHIMMERALNNNERPFPW